MTTRCRYQLQGILALTVSVVVGMMIWYHFKNKKGSFCEKFNSKKVGIFIILLVLDLSK